MRNPLAAAAVIVALTFGVMAIIYLGSWFRRKWPSRARGGRSKLPYESEWTAAQAVYQADRRATVTCVHLKGIEGAMRNLGIHTQMVVEPWREYSPWPKIRADCCVNVHELRGRFALLAPAKYQEGYQPERHEFDNPWGAFTCAECQSRIAVNHSEWGRGQVPWFPIAPR